MKQHLPVSRAERPWIELMVPCTREAAEGTVRFISQIDYSKSDPVISMPDESSTDDMDGIQNTDDERAVAQRGRERDREQQTEVRRAEPVIRADADARGQVPVRAAIPVNRPAPGAPTPAPKTDSPPRATRP